MSAWSEAGKQRFLSPPLGEGIGLPTNESMVIPLEGADYLDVEVPGDGSTIRGAFASSLKEAVRAFPFKITHVLTDRGSCFTADGFEEACRKLKVQHRKTKPYTPETNGLVERFNGRVQREVLGITIYSHRDLETLLKGFNQAYNRRRCCHINAGLTRDRVDGSA